MKQSIIYILLFMLTSIQAQQFSGKIIDAKTNEGIPFATIQTGEHKGVISNEDGYFSINLDNKTTLSFSCMGYQAVTLEIAEIKSSNNIVSLEEAVNELGAVFLNKTKPNANEIIAKVVNNIPENYHLGMQKYQVFTREKSGFNAKKLSFKIKKATGFRKKMLKDANTSLDSLANIIKNSNSTHYSDMLGDLYVRDADSAKLNVIKTTMLLDKKNNFSPENMEDKFQAILFKYLNKDKTYKVKTGLFKIEDSLSFDDILEKEAEEASKNEINTSSLRSTPMGFLEDSNLNTESRLRKFLDNDLYKYSLENMVYFNNNIIYIINFEPARAKAKFSGTLYITDGDFALIKANYGYAEGKRGQKVNLRLILGIKFIDNHKKGAFMFTKVDDKYVPQYAMEESGQYIYLHRPIKFKENGFKKNNVTFDGLVEGSTLEKFEILFKDAQQINKGKFNAIKEAKKTPFEELKSYDPNTWKAYNVLEPLEDMKNFKVEEQ